MPRVDEALRRAAEAAGHAQTLPPPAAAGIAPDAVAGLSFPEESAEAAGPADGARAPAAVLESPDGPAFEHLHAMLASKVVVDRNMLPGAREQYRRLAAALHHSQAANGLKVVMIASAMVGEGKTLTAANLALTLSESYQRSVLLIDADLRRPSLNSLFGLNGASGLSEALAAADDQALPIQRISPLLTVLPAGKPSGDPMAGLTSERMRRVLADARKTFGWVIIDTPPVGLLTDANLLASMVDGAVLVVEAGSTPYDLIRRAVEAIGSDRMLGVVLNRAAAHAQGYEYHDHYAYYGATGQARASVPNAGKAG